MKEQNNADQNSPSFTFDASIDSSKHDDLASRDHQAHADALEHVNRQKGIPELMKPALIAAEMTCRVNRGRVIPTVNIDGGRNSLVVPPDTVLHSFMLDCLTRFATDNVSAYMMSPEGDFIVGYMSKEVELAAKCSLQRTKDGVVLGDWIVEPARGENQAQPKARIGRNSRCPCGSGRKFKKCCGRRDLRQSGEEDVPTEAEFAERLITSVRNAGESAELEYDADKSIIRRAGEPCFILHNAFAAYRQAPVWHRNSIVKNYSRGWFSRLRELPESFEDAKSDLLPVVCRRAQYESQFLTGDDFRVFGVVGEHLAIGLVYDFPESMCHINEDTLKKWNVTREEAFDAAIENLRQISLPPEFSMHVDGFYVADYHDDYTASRLLLPEVIESLPVDGGVVAMVPNRRTLLVTGSDDERALAAMANLAQAALKKTHLISGIPLRMSGEHWEPFAPPEDHPAHNQFRDLWLESMADEYRTQAPNFATFAKRNKMPGHIATFMLIPGSDANGPASVCTVGDGVPTYCPRTDFVGFVIPKGGNWSKPLEAIMDAEVLTVTWDEAREMFGDMMIDVPVYPERHFVEIDYSPEMVARMRELDKRQEWMQGDGESSYDENAANEILSKLLPKLGEMLEGESQ